MEEENRSVENRKLKIAMLGHKTVPAMDSSRGGIEVVVEELAPRLVEMGCDVTCYNRSGCDNGGLKEYKGVKLKTVPTWKKRGFAAMSSSFFATIRATFGGYDVIHFHAEGPGFWMWIPAFVNIFKKKKTKLLLHNHGRDWERACWRGSLASKYIKAAEKLSAKKADAIIVLSKNIQEYYRQTYKRKTVYISNGVDKPELREAKEIKEKFGLEKNSYMNAA